MIKPSAILFAIYSVVVSPVLFSLGARCRFHPTCSVYAKAAFDNYGFIKASQLSIKRLIKCGPWHPGGIDELQTNLKEVEHEI